MTIDEAFDEIRAGMPTTLSDYEIFANHVGECSGCKVCNLVEQTLL